MGDIFNIPTPDSIDPRLWGRGAWEFLDMVVVMYPIENPPMEQRDAVIALLENLHHYLPCPVCKQNYQQFLLNHPIGNAVLSRNNLIEFYYALRMDTANHTGQQNSRFSMRDMWTQVLNRFGLQPGIHRDRIVPMNATARYIDERRLRNVRRAGCACNQ